MTSTFCIALSIVTIGVGATALHIGLKDFEGGMAAKIGGAFITVIGLLGLVACFMSTE